MPGKRSGGLFDSVDPQWPGAAAGKEMTAEPVGRCLRLQGCSSGSPARHLRGAHGGHGSRARCCGGLGHPLGGRLGLSSLLQPSASFA